MQPGEGVPLDFLGDLERTHTCGELRAADAGKSAKTPAHKAKSSASKSKPTRVAVKKHR